MVVLTYNGTFFFYKRVWQSCCFWPRSYHGCTSGCTWCSHYNRTIMLLNTSTEAKRGVYDRICMNHVCLDVRYYDVVTYKSGHRSNLASLRQLKNVSTHRSTFCGLRGAFEQSLSLNASVFTSMLPATKRRSRTCATRATDVISERKHNSPHITRTFFNNVDRSTSPNAPHLERFDVRAV